MKSNKMLLRDVESGISSTEPKALPPSAAERPDGAQISSAYNSRSQLIRIVDNEDRNGDANEGVVELVGVPDPGSLKATGTSAYDAKGGANKDN